MGAVIKKIIFKNKEENIEENSVIDNFFDLKIENLDG